MGETKKKLLILTNYYEEGPSSRYRSFNYKVFFEKEFEVDYKPLFYNGYVKKIYNSSNNNISFFFKIKSILKRIKFIIKNKKKYDHIIIETELVKFLPYFFERILLYKSSYSLDYDDNPNLIYKKNKILKILYGNKITNLSKRAKFVTVGNKWYFDEIKSNNLKYLPTVIDIEKYFIVDNKNNEAITIVWIGSRYTEKYLNIVHEPLKRLSKQYRIKLKLIGSTKKMDGVEVENILWSEEKEVEEISNSDIGIMPLENNYWEKGKCGFKLIQYMACGLPVIGSISPANNEIIRNNENGYIVSDDKEWYEALEKLIINKNLRTKFGKISKEIIEENYTYQKWYLKYIEYLKS